MTMKKHLYILFFLLIATATINAQDKLKCCGTIITPQHIAESHKLQKAGENTISKIETDGIFRTYRLAIPVDNRMYINDFYGNMTSVYEFWSEIETFINNIYAPALGIKFEVIKNNNLIITQEYQSPFKNTTYLSEIVYAGTQEINKLIDENSYDAGIWLANSMYDDVTGMADLAGVYKKSSKGNAVVTVKQANIVGHELGHLFGAYHTHNNDGSSSSKKVEPGNGRSMMGYGGDMNFFHLNSINEINNRIKNTPYYIDTARTQLYGTAQADANYTYGVTTTSQVPIINESELAKTMRVPQGSYFQVTVPATDTDNDYINYMVHQMDAYFKSKFIAHKSSTSPTVTFLPEFNRNGLLIYYTDEYPSAQGVYKFWLSASDGSLASNKAPLYDVVEKNINIEAGTPFVITSPNWDSVPNHSFGKNQCIDLRWSVDQNIFAQDSKVRILLSDDLGDTFKYVLKNNVDNNGYCRIILPNQIFEQHSGLFDQPVRPCVIKIEVINGLSFALSPHFPATNSQGNPTSNYADLYDLQWGGGFLITEAATKINFQGLPEPFIAIESQNFMPDTADVTATTTNGQQINVIFEESQPKTIGDSIEIVRIWSCTAPDGSIYAFEQTIHYPSTGEIIETDTYIVENSGVLIKGNKVFVDNGKAILNKIDVYNAQGILIESLEAASQYDMNYLPQGVYFIYLTYKNGKSAETLKLMIK